MRYPRFPAEAGSYTEGKVFACLKLPVIITSVVAVTLAAGLAPAGAAPLLKPGDTVALVVKGEEDISRFYILDDEGRMDFGEMGQLKVAGLSVEQARQAVITFLSRYIRQPDVQFTLAKPKGYRITITGDVKSPGTVEAVTDVSIRDILAFAGGPLPTADLSQVTLVRGGEFTRVNLSELMASPDPSKDIILQDGDQVNVPSRVIGEFTFLGAVKSVGTYPLLRGTKVLDALKMAGGVEEGARVETIRVVRPGQDEVTVNLTALLAGRVEENVVILPGDTLVASSDQMAPTSYSIIGGVYKPGRYELKQKLTWTEALATAGGFNPNARQDKVVLIRKQADGKYQSIPLDFSKILEGTEDPELFVQDGDVLNVPEKTPRQRSPILEWLPIIGPLLYIL
jgi:protein involved in polysaccharide export with SLBB domain